MAEIGEQCYWFRTQMEPWIERYNFVKNFSSEVRRQTIDDGKKLIFPNMPNPEDKLGMSSEKRTMSVSFRIKRVAQQVSILYDKRFA